MSLSKQPFFHVSAASALRKLGTGGEARFYPAPRTAVKAAALGAFLNTYPLAHRDSKKLIMTDIPLSSQKSSCQLQKPFGEIILPMLGVSD